MRTSIFLLRLSAALCGAAAFTFAQSTCEKLKSMQPADAVFTAVELVPAGPVPPLPVAARGVLQGLLRSPARQRAVGVGVARLVDVARLRRDAARLLSRRCDAQAFHRFRHPDGTLYAGRELERKVPDVGQRRLGRIIQGIAGMQSALREGYATAATDTGHQKVNGMFALGHPEKITDFAYRAVHETVVKSKMLITAFYGKAPKYSYWNGCSTGGRQALVEVTKFPDDFDGVLAGAPANPHIHFTRRAWSDRKN